MFDDLEIWLGAQLPKISGKSELAKAIRYALTRMKKLRPYLDHGFLEIDNNSAERAMRCVALGRENSIYSWAQKVAENLPQSPTPWSRRPNSTASIRKPG